MTTAGDTVDAAATDASLWVTLAEAGRRQSPPVSRAAVSKRVKKLSATGRLGTRPGPQGSVLVNLVAYLRAVREETDPAQDLRNGRSPLLDELPATDDEPPPGDPGYHQSRARREAFNAENARLDLEERLDRLADREDVEHRTMQVFRLVRDRLLGMPATLSGRLHAQPDARAVRAVMTEEVRRLLDGLADTLDQMDRADASTDMDDVDR